MSAVTIKAFRHKDGLLGSTPSEIRRFTLDQSVISNFTTMKVKISQVFSGLNDNFGLYWKDAEGDFISFSSDDELLEALGNVSDNVFRVYVIDNKENGQQQQSSGNENNQTEHPNVFCDGCQGPVIGYRYKCTVCPDYDLCQTCEGKGVHSEHNMMRISNPSFSFHAGMRSGPFAFDFGRRGGRHGHGPHHGGPHHGGPHHWGPPPPPPPAPEGSCPFAGGPPPHVFMGMGGMNPDGTTWGDMGNMPPNMEPMNRFWKRCMRQAARAQTRKDNRKEETKQKPDQPETSSEPMPEADDNDDNNEDTPYTGEDYLKDMGETVAAFLEPLGIDVAVDIEHAGKRERVNPQFGPAQPQPATSSAKPAAETKAADKMDVDQSTGERAAATAPRPQPSSTGSSPLYPNISKQQRETDWTFVIPADTVPEPAVVSPLEPKIQTALGMMKTMGFNDDGGWLTRLLIAKDGDIVRVLDAIKPQPGNNNGNA